MGTTQLTYYLNTRSPKISRGLSSQTGGEFDITAADTFRLRVRPLWGDTPVVDAEMTKDEANDLLEYAPTAGDFDTEGIYKAWITVLIGGTIPQDTDEFEIRVLAHAPGDAVRVGAIWRAARALAPVAWDNVRGYEGYGDVELQRVIELAKRRVFSIAVTAAQEESQDPRVVDYVAKKVLVDNVLPAAIDYWTNVLVSQSARSNADEVKTYPDRIRAVEGQIVRFEGHLKAQAAEVADILGSTTSTITQGPVLVGGGRLLTPGLEHLEPIFPEPAVVIDQ